MLNIAKSSSIPTPEGSVKKRVYEVDIGELFNAITGLEDKSRSLGALVLQPGVDNTLFKIKNAAGEVVLSFSTSTGELYIGGDIDDL